VSLRERGISGVRPRVKGRICNFTSTIHDSPSQVILQCFREMRLALLGESRKTSKKRGVKEISGPFVAF